jgi:hypothetical protein
MKPSLRVDPFLLGALLLCSSQPVASQLRGIGEAQDASGMPSAGFVQLVPNGPSFGGQVFAAGQQMPPASAPQLLQGSAPAPVAAPLSAAQADESVKECNCDGKSAANAVDATCSISKVTVHQDHAANAGMSLAGISAIWGSTTLSQEQREKIVLGKVSETSFSCLDDRVSRASFFTPGGDLGEFILALSSYLQERDPTGRMLPSQEVVDALLLKYLQTIPATRPMIHCTDDRAVAHLEAEIPLEGLDLSSPPRHAQASLLQKLIEVENHGDSHIRLLLKKPEWFQLNQYLAPMAIKSFYHLLWDQNTNDQSPLHASPKLKLEVLVGQSDPQAFLEVSSGELCHNSGVAPMLTPHTPQRAVLISHLDAVSLRRKELAAFFTRIANASPRKINKDQLHQRLDRHGWLALETTGSRVASGLPFYTLTYT